MKTTNRISLRLVAASLLLLAGLLSGCGSGSHSAASLSGTSSTATRGKGAVAFTVHWPAMPKATSRLLPIASKAIKFNVVEYAAPNNVVVLTKTVARPSDDQTISTVLLDGLPTVLVNIQVAAYPNADATGTVQASGSATVEIQQNKTIDQSVTLASTITKVEVSSAPIAISSDGKLSLNLSDQTDIKATLTATAYNAAHEMVLTALDKWVFKSASPAVATVTDPTVATKAAKHRAEGIDSSATTVTGMGDGSSAITITESESQVSTTVTVDVTGSRNILWNQALGDAQNSSCSSGPGAAGNIVSSFGPIPDNDGSGNYADASFDDIGSFVESGTGEVAFVGKAIYISDGGISVYTKSGSKLSHLGGFFGDPQDPTYGPDGTLYGIGAGYGSTGHITARGPSGWSYDAEFYFSNTSALTLSGDGATIYVVLSGNLTALDAHTGDKKWEASTTSPGNSGGASKPAVSLDNTVVYCGTGAGVTAFDAATGNKIWDSGGVPFTEGGYVGVGPTGIVYVADISTTRALRAIDPANGQTLWTKDNFGGPFVLCRNGTVYGNSIATDTPSSIVALNGATGGVLWTKATNNGSGNSYSMGGGGFAAADGTLYVIKAETRDLYNVYRLTALDGASGADKWTLTPNLFTGTGGSGPYTGGSYSILAVGGDGTLYAFEGPPDANSAGPIVSIR